jgi:glyoxylase-like metal-dependent hydrolase (beta-lactamase superfamily II)
MFGSSIVFGFEKVLRAKRLADMESERFPVVKVIKIGSICHEASEIASTFNLMIKSDLRIGGGSTVTIIEGEQKILIDTGFDYEWLDTIENINFNRSNLRRALHENGLEPDDIDIVFITHWHKDHFGNLSIFKKSQYMASMLLVEQFDLKNFVGLNNNQFISKGIKIVFTPGHTAGHASILIDSSLRGVKARIAVAGDAIISHSYFQSGHVWHANADFVDAQMAKMSINLLVELSDLIIPGHGVPFLVK